MRKLLRVTVGVVCLIAGGALFLFCGADVLATLAHPVHGMTIADLAGAILGAAIIGAGADLCGWVRVGDPPPASGGADVHGAARPASQIEALRAARGDTKSPLHDQTFAR